MIDGLTLIVNPEIMRNSDILEFIDKGNKQVAKYQGLTIDLYSNQCYVRGSIHKYRNKGIHNADDFTLSSFIKTLQNLTKDLNINEETTLFQRVEIGVNIDLDIDINTFLSYVLFYKRKTFVPLDKLGLICKNNQFDIKLYNKRLKGQKDKLRVEVAIKHKAKRNKIIEDYAPYCNTLTDLTNSYVWRAFGDELIEVFNDILTIDKDSLKTHNLKPKEIDIYTKGISSFYWSKEWRSNATRARHFKRFVEVINKHSDQTVYLNAKEALRLKIDKLIDIENIPIYQQPRQENETFSMTCKNVRKKESETFSIVDKGTNSFNTDSNKKRCAITKLSLDIGIRQNRTLSTKGVEYYYNNNRTTYNNVLYPRLSNNAKSKPLKQQFETIAHSLRNELSNPRHNLKRDLENKEKEMRMLFDFRDMLRSDKKGVYKEIAY